MGRLDFTLLLLYIYGIIYVVKSSSNVCLLKLETPKHIGNVIVNDDCEERPIPVQHKNLVKLLKVDIPLIARVHEPRSRRSLIEFARVESGPGSIKTDLVTYPPNYLKDRLKRLLFLKERNEENNKDLNANK